MGFRTVAESRSNLNSLQIFSLFCIVFFLITMILTAFFIVPKINENLQSQRDTSVKTDLVLEAKLFMNFVDSQRTILQDVAKFPSIANAAMLSDSSSPALIDLFENIVIGGESGRLVLQDIAGTVLLKSTSRLQGSYTESEAWLENIVEGVIPYTFYLLSQKDDDFTFQMSIPVMYNSSIEGILSAEITAPLSQVFIAQSITQNIAFKLVQPQATVATDSSKIKIAHEVSMELGHPDLTFSYITDDAIIRENERSLRNTILSVLFTGLSVSFLLFAVIGFRSLVSGEKNTVKKPSIDYSYTIPITVAIIGIFASMISYMFILNLQQGFVEKELLTKSKSRIQSIRHSIHQDLALLDSIRAFFDASEFVDRQEFRTFVNPIITNHPGIDSLHWIPLVPIKQRVNYEVQGRADGIKEFVIQQLDYNGELIPARTRDVYFPIQYSEPAERYEQPLGFDLSSIDSHLAAITKSIRHGNKVATPPIHLMQQNNGQVRVMVFLPIYRQPNATSLHDSGISETVRGLALLVFHIDKLIAEHLPNGNPGQSIHIEDISKPDKPISIIGNAIKTTDSTFSETINVASRTWRVDTYITPATIPLRWVIWLIPLGGIAFTSFLIAGSIHLIKRKEVVEALIKQRTSELRMLSSIVANSNDSFMITDANKPDPQTGRRRIVYVNDAFTRLTGYNYDEVIGKTPHFLHGEKTDKNLFEKLMNTVNRGESFRGEFLHYTKLGKTHWIDVNVVPLKDEHGNVMHFGAVQRDITERKRAENERESLIGKLTDSNEELARFAFVCSHDLQEPLRMIRSYSEKLQAHIANDLDHDEKGKKYFWFITDGAARAQNLITDILAYSSIENDTQQLQQIDTINLIERIRHSLQESLDETGGTITHDSLPTVAGNKTQLYQLFQNLINNAIKYQPPNAAPHVHVSVTDQGRFWQFAIKDNGIGMEQRHLGKIFDVFQRLHRRSKYAGTGVGLSICKKVVTRHGGTIWVKSEVGTGSTFYFTLPKTAQMEIVANDRRQAS